MHLPDTTTPDGLLDLLCACTLVILGNVLDHRTYQAPRPTNFKIDGQNVDDILLDADINAIPAEERLACCYARGVALRVMQWIRDCAFVMQPNGDIYPDIATFFLEKTLATLEHYRLEIAKRGFMKSSPFSAEAFVDQLVNIRKIYNPSWHVPEKVDTDVLGMEDFSSCRIRWTSRAERWQDCDTGKYYILIFSSSQYLNHSIHTEFLAGGTTPFDSKFFQAQTDLQNCEKTLVLPRIKVEDDWDIPKKRSKHL